MGVSAGAAATGAIIAVVGLVILAMGVSLFASGPMFSAQSQRDNGILGIGGSQSSSASFNPIPLLGLVLVPVGGLVLYKGMKGTMNAFERGKERDEGTRHHLTVKRE